VFTFSLQVVVTLFLLAAGLAGLAVSRHRSVTREAHRVTWWLAGTILAMHGGNKLAQNAFGYWAMVAGPDSPVLARYLEWAPFFNHSRTVLWLFGCGLFAYLVWNRQDEPPRFRPLALGILVLAMVGGGLLGSWKDETLVAATHYTTVAVGDAVELVVVLGTLFALLVSDRADRYLWATLATYGFMVALNVVWFAALSLLDDPNVWSPSPWHIHAYRVVLTFLILSLTVRRLVLARRGTAVAGLLDRRSSPAPTLAH
jgi:hypothetical protein